MHYGQVHLGDSQIQNLFGPRRTATTINRAAGVGVGVGVGAIAQMSGENAPRDLLVGRAFWAGETAVVFPLPSSAVRKLTAYMVVMLKQQLQRVLHWRAVFTFYGMGILSARGAYAGLSQVGWREQQCAGLVLSNRYAALEPDAELSTDDEDEELVPPSEEEEEELVPASDDEEQPPRGTQPAARSQARPAQKQGIPAAPPPPLLGTCAAG